MSFYQRMQATSKRLLSGKFNQGPYTYLEPAGEADPFNPAPEPIEHQVSGAQAPAKDKKTYIDGGYIVATDTLLAVAPFSVAPSQSGTMQINGETYQIIMVDSPTTLPDPDQLVWFIGCRK